MQNPDCKTLYASRTSKFCVYQANSFLENSQILKMCNFTRNKYLLFPSERTLSSIIQGLRYRNILKITKLIFHTLINIYGMIQFLKIAS